MKRYLNIAALLTLSSVLFACGQSFTINTPRGFIVLEEERASQYEFRSTSADGIVIAVRDIENEQEGTLEFWAEAVTSKLRDSRGYAMLEESDISAGGVQGKQIRFGRDESGHSYRYWVTVFVRSEGANARIWVIEAGGRQEVFERRQEEIERTIASFRPR